MILISFSSILLLTLQLLQLELRLPFNISDEHFKTFKLFYSVSDFQHSNSHLHFLQKISPFLVTYQVFWVKITVTSYNTMQAKRTPHSAALKNNNNVKLSPLWYCIYTVFLHIPLFPHCGRVCVCVCVRVEGSCTRYLLKRRELTDHGSRQGQVLALGMVAQNNMPSGQTSAGFQLRTWFACWDPSSCIKGSVYVCTT